MESSLDEIDHTERVAEISQMKKFTSGICLHEDGKFYAVDYVNADPDINPRSFYPNGVPDEGCGISFGCCSMRDCT